MASGTAFDSLALVAAALSALTEKHIVTKAEYARISEEVKRGVNKVYVCAGEVNVVEEIKQTYAKTARLVAQRHNPDITRNMLAIPIRASGCEKAEAKKYPKADIRAKKVSLLSKQMKRPGESTDKVKGKSTNTPSVKTSRWYRGLSFRGKISLFSKRKNENKPYKGPNYTACDYKHVTENTEIFDGDKPQKKKPKRRFYRRRFNPREYQRMDINSSSDEECSIIKRKRRTNTSSPEDTKAYSDVETRMKLTSTSWKNIQLQGNLEKNKSYQDIHEMCPDFEENTHRDSSLFGSTESDQKLTDSSFQIRNEKARLLTDKPIGRARHVSKKKEKQKDSCSSEEHSFRYTKHHSETEISLTEKVDSLTIASRQDQVQRTAKTTNLFVILPLGRTITVEMESTHSLIINVKQKIKERVGLDVMEQVLQFGGHLLVDGRSLHEYKIKANSTIHLSVKGRGGSKMKLFYIDSTYLDPSWDYDFTDVSDGNAQFKRGGYTYYRPCGWNRIAIKVLGKYQSNIWLGQTGEGSNGEWAVTYHGTKYHVFNNIANKGYKIGIGAALGRGVYSSPRIDTAAAGYAKEFNYNGVTYKGVFQNRVNPKGMKVVNNGQYWLCPNKDDIRPYGLCVKKCTKTYSNLPIY